MSEMDVIIGGVVSVLMNKRIVSIYARKFTSLYDPHMCCYFSLFRSVEPRLTNCIDIIIMKDVDTINNKIDLVSCKNT